MKTVGIVSEYNPFHNGHQYHLEKTKNITACDNVIAIMSGDFVQRGEPAMINKFVRTKMALLSGVDAVIELPVVFSSSGAERFAYGAIMLMDALNTVDTISFGAESEDICRHLEVAKILSDEPDEFKQYLKTELSCGQSFPRARQRALERLTQRSEGFLEHPNNILAIEYLKAITKLKSNIKPVAVKRMSAPHNSTTIEGSVCSATAIRKAVTQRDYDAIRQTVPSSCFELLMNEINNGRTASINNISDIFHYIIRTKSSGEIAQILGIVEGLENRILRCSESYYYLSEIAKAAKTKRYTLAGLQRAILHIILDIKACDAENCLTSKDSCYIRILGFRKDKRSLISQISKNASLPVVMHMKKDSEKLSPLTQHMLETQLRSSDIYRLAMDSKAAVCLKNIDLYEHPVIL